VEILKALFRRTEILILDEPTAVLTPQETEQLFHLLARLRQQGKTVILVTHKLREIMAATDRVTVMRQGAVVYETATRATSERALAESMVGRPVLLQVGQAPARPGEVLLAVKDLEVRDRFGVTRVRQASFELRAGEILGLAGVTGNGQSELLEAVAGILPPSRGEIVSRALTWWAVGSARANGGGSASPTCRKIGCGWAWLPHFPRRPMRSWAITTDRPTTVTDFCAGRPSWPAASAKCAITMCVRQPRMPLSAFSGGNQQKLVLAREIDCDPQVLLVASQPAGSTSARSSSSTGGWSRCAIAGKAVLLVSVELDEILGLADRILVMFNGEITGEVASAEATEQKLGLMMAGVKEGDA